MHLKQLNSELYMNVLDKRRVIVALDTPLNQALELIPLLAPYAAGFKIGFRRIASGGANQLITLVEAQRGPFVFYDGKFCDIPNTVAEAVGELNNLYVKMCNVHCRGGVQMMAAAASAAEGHHLQVLGVTLLTSLSVENLQQEGMIPLGMSLEFGGEQLRRCVRQLATMAYETGLDGVVASPQETAMIRQLCGPEFLIVTPGIRPTNATSDDQKRVGTPRQAILDGSTYLVVGRPVYEAPDPVAALQAINEEVTVALAEREKGAVAV